MANKRKYFLNVGLLFSAFLLISRISSAEISLTVIGESKKIPQNFSEGLKQYLPQFQYVYYNYKNSKVRNVLKKLNLSYFPVVVYDKNKLTETDKEFLKKKRLITRKGDYNILPFSQLHYITKN